MYNDFNIALRIADLHTYCAETVNSYSNELRIGPCNKKIRYFNVCFLRTLLMNFTI